MHIPLGDLRHKTGLLNLQRVALVVTWIFAGGWYSDASADIRQTTGRVTSLRVHEMGSAFGPPNDRIDVEVVIRLDSEPNKAFGFQLRNDARLAAHQGMLEVCRDAFNNGWTITIDFDIQPGKLNGLLIRATINRKGGTITDVENVVDAASDPAAAGRLDPAVLDEAPPTPPEEVGKGAHALMDKTRWNPVERFELAPGGSRDVTVSIDAPALVLAHASWTGASVPLSLRIVRGGTVLAAGEVSPVPPDQGVVVSTVEVTTTGNVAVNVENPSGTAAAVQVAVGVLPLAQ
jgi:hypothetical protein